VALVKALVDLLPVVAFFAAYYLTPDPDQRFFVATGVAIVACLLQVGFVWLHTRQVERMHLVTLALMLVLGGLTLLLNDRRFFLWKPTLVNWCFALAFLASHLTARPLIERMLGHALELPARQWAALNLAWVAHFTLLGGLNLWVAFSFPEPVWVNFKLFGIFGLTLLFALLQGVWLARVGAAPREDPGEHR
jgi:intracellular septation protein